MGGGSVRLAPALLKLPRGEDRANIVAAVGVGHITTGHMHDVVVVVDAAVGRRPTIIICQLRPTICRKQRVNF